MNSLIGKKSENFRPLKFTAEEIAEAISRANDKYGVEVSYCPSEIKFYPKDKNSLKDSVKLTVEEFIKVPGKIWHMELMPDITSESESKSECLEPRNHVRWAGIPFTVMLDKVIECLDYEPVLWPAGTGLEEKC